MRVQRVHNVERYWVNDKDLVAVRRPNALAGHTEATYRMVAITERHQVIAIQIPLAVCLAAEHG